MSKRYITKSTFFYVRFDTSFSLTSEVNIVTWLCYKKEASRLKFLIQVSLTGAEILFLQYRMLHNISFYLFMEIFHVDQIMAHFSMCFWSSLNVFWTHKTEMCGFSLSSVKVRSEI